MSVSVYNDDDYQTPVYVIEMGWEKGIPRFHWIKYDLYLVAKPIADELVTKHIASKSEQKTARYTIEIMRAVQLLLECRGFTVKMEFPKFEETDGHIRKVFLHK